MMGTHQPKNELFNYRVNLEQRVRRDHPLRRISATLGLPGLVEQHQVNTGSEVQCAVGDKHYGSAELIRR